MIRTEQTRYFYIYALTDPRNNEVRYIGKAVNPKHRLSSHISASKNYHTKKDNWLKKLLSLNLKPIIEILWIDDNNETIEQAEMFFIDRYKKDGANLTNGSNGGKGSFGRTVSEATRNKLSQMFKGRKLSPAHIKKIGESSKINWQKEDYRAKIIKSLKNRICTEETKLKCRISKLAIRDQISKRVKERMNSELNHLRGKKLSKEHIANIAIHSIGSKNGNSILNEETVRYIRDMRKRGASRRKIFRTFKDDSIVTLSRLDNVLYSGWRHVV